MLGTRGQSQGWHWGACHLSFIVIALQGSYHQQIFAQCRMGQCPLEEFHDITEQAQQGPGALGSERDREGCHTETDCLQGLSVTSDLALIPSNAPHGL